MHRFDRVPLVRNTLTSWVCRGLPCRERAHEIESSLVGQTQNRLNFFPAGKGNAVLAGSLRASTVRWREMRAKDDPSPSARCFRHRLEGQRYPANICLDS